MNRHKQNDNSSQAKGPLLMTGILFALAANMLLVTTMDTIVGRLALPISYEVLATLVAPFIAGAATSFYVKQRGGIHAFIGGVISIPLLAAVVFNGNWQFAILAGAFCGLAGAITEIALRRQRTNR